MTNEGFSSGKLLNIALLAIGALAYLDLIWVVLHR